MSVYQSEGDEYIGLHDEFPDEPDEEIEE